MNKPKERLEELRSELRTECLSYGEIAELQDLAGHIAADDLELLEVAGVPEGTTYYERVRDEVERVGECTTSDAQGILEAWELKQGNVITSTDALDAAEAEGITPADLANQILN